MAKSSGQNDPYKETRRQVRTWLLSQKYSLQDVNEPDKAWVVIAMEAQQTGFGFGVSQHRGEADVIGIAITMPFPPFANPFGGLSAGDHEALVYDIRLKLAQFDVEFNVPNDLSEIVLGHHIYLDALTQDRFFQAVHTLRRALLTVQWTLEKKVSGRKPPTNFNITGGVTH